MLECVFCASLMCDNCCALEKILVVGEKKIRENNGSFKIVLQRNEKEISFCCIKEPFIICFILSLPLLLMFYYTKEKNKLLKILFRDVYT